VNALLPAGWLLSEVARYRVPGRWRGSKQDRQPDPHQDCPPPAHPTIHRGNAVFVIGVDPHKGSHTAAVLNATEEVIAQVLVEADAQQLGRLLAWAEPFTPRRWAVEGAGGTGALLARQLAAAGEDVVDVPPTLSARVRLLDRGRSAKTDAHDARAAAIVALRHQNLRAVVVEDHDAVLRLLADRHHDLVAQRTRVVCRLHALLAQLREGGVTTRLGADRAAQLLRGIRPVGAADVERKRQCLEHVAEIRRLDTQLADLRTRIAQAVTASETTVTDVHGVGPLVAAIIVGHTGGVARFPTAGHFARFNGTAPIDASSGEVRRHRLNPRGNRHLNHALHVAAVTQIAHDTPGRRFYLRKLTEGHSRREALRALKRRISDAVYRHLQADATRGTERTTRDDTKAA
jgi:transposase